jgi:hypothetical protein
VSSVNLTSEVEEGYGVLEPAGQHAQLLLDRRLCLQKPNQTMVIFAENKTMQIFRNFLVLLSKPTLHSTHYTLLILLFFLFVYSRQREKDT